MSKVEETKIMASKATLTTAVITQAESYDGIQAGIVRLKAVLKTLHIELLRKVREAQPRWTMFRLLIGQKRLKQY